MFTIIFIIANDEELDLLVQQDRSTSVKFIKQSCSLILFY